MGFWKAKSGNIYLVNLEDDLIKAMQKAGARFCFMKDTPGIKNRENETFYMDDNEDKDEDEEKGRVFRQGITVTAENGEPVTGYISHWVENKQGKTSGTDIKAWFIIQYGTYPTKYVIEKSNDDIIVTEL